MDYDTPLFYQVMEYAERAERDVIDMVSGNPDWEPPASLRAGLREFADFSPAQFQYGPSEGINPLRTAISDRRNVPAEQVVVTNGTGEANYLALAAALERSSGDEVICIDPVYPYYPAKVELLGGTVKFVAAGPSGDLDPHAVDRVAGPETAAILVNTPNNPTGAVYDQETMEALVTVAGDADALLISDEVYDHFDWSGHFASALEIDSPNRIVTSGFSKSLAITGLRVGYLVVPPALVDAVTTRHMLVNVTGSRPAQHAVARALAETPPAYYEENRQRLATRTRTFAERLSSEATVTRPDGAFYVLVKFEDHPGTLETVYELIDEAGVAGMPGATFGDSCADWLRFACLTPAVEEAADRLRAHLE